MPYGVVLYSFMLGRQQYLRTFKVKRYTYFHFHQQSNCLMVKWAVYDIIVRLWKLTSNSLLLFVFDLQYKGKEDKLKGDLSPLIWYEKLCPYMGW